MKVILLAGEPASGKSTLIKTVFSGPGVAFKTGLVCGSEHPGGVLLLGIYKEGETYPGTDRLSMAVQPQILKFLKLLQKRGDVRVVVAEGDRITNASLLRELELAQIETHVVILDAGKENLDVRRVARGDTFKDAWLRGRKTKVEGFRRQAEKSSHLQIWKSQSRLDLSKNAEVLSGMVF